MRGDQKILVLGVKFRQLIDDFDGGLPSHQQIKRTKMPRCGYLADILFLPIGCNFAGGSVAELMPHAPKQYRFLGDGRLYSTLDYLAS